MRHGKYISVAVILTLILTGGFSAGVSTLAWAQKSGGAAPASDEEFDTSRSEMREVIERYTLNRGSLNRSYPVANSPTRRARFKEFDNDWLTRIAKMNFETMSHAGQVDYVLLKNHLHYELRQLEIQEKEFAEIESLIPFAKTITELEESRRKMEVVNAQKIAIQLNDLKKQVDDRRRAVEAGLRANTQASETGGRSQPVRISKTVANQAVAALGALRGNLRNWYSFYNGYDPIFTWWNEEPYRALDQSLAGYVTFLSERVIGLTAGDASATGGTGGGRPNFAGGGGRGGDGQGGQGGAPSSAANARFGDSSDIIGDPIGREALMVDLANEMIPYTPEELIAIGEKELAWCEAEMKKAARELGYGEDWRKALEYVKTLHVEPGKQPQLIRDLALEAIDYVEKNDLLTVPQLAKESWRMEMMTPERQLVNPFFTGGETISVSYPTNTMSHEAKLMSMRGNNIHFSRATVHHELIPGHHLQGYMTARYKPYRGLFSTPFWGEGWSLYWELLLWDMGFAKTPENKIGMLFWRSHRCARIIFSLSFHLGKMTPQQCIDLLVNRVGHEVDNATAEVRRSFAGSYSPLYQAAYLLGGLQIYSLHKELVKSGKMSNRQFHDTILKENRIPIEMVRAILTKQKLTRDFQSSWKFYGAMTN